MSSIIGAFTSAFGGGSIGRASVDLVLNSTAYNAQLSEAEGKTKGATGGLSQAFDDVKNSIGPVGVAAVGMAVVAVGAISKAVATTQQWADSVRKLQQVTGQSAESASQLAAAGSQLGVGTDQLTTGFGLLSKNIENGSANLIKYGVATTDAQGNTLPFDQILGNLADKFNTLQAGPAQAAFAMNAFGRSGKAMIPILQQGSAGLQQFYDDATKAGVVMSQDDLAASKNLSIAQAQLGEAFKGLAITVGREFIPALTSAVQVVTNFLEIVRPVFDLLTPFADALQATADGTAAMTGATNENTSALKSNLLTQQQVIALHQKGEATSADYAAKWAQLTQQVNEGKITQDEANAAYDRFTSATTHATLATEDSTTAIERHTAALVKDVKAQEANRLEQLKTAGGLLGLTASLQQTQQDQAALNKLQEQGKQKTQAYRDAVVQATTDQLSFRTAVRQFFADNPDVKLGVMRDTLRQMAAQAGVSASQFKSALGPALDNIIGKVTNLRDKTQAPFMVTFSVDTSNLESAAARAMQLKRQLAHGL